MIADECEFMPRKKKKPEYNPKMSMDELVKEVADAYGSFDDRKADRHEPSLNSLATEYDLNVLKVRKILIIAGVYSTATSRRIASLANDGLSIGEIVEITELSRASVNSYLPYEGYAYKLPGDQCGSRSVKGIPDALCGGEQTDEGGPRYREFKCR